MGAFYLVCQVAELAAGYGYTTWLGSTLGMVIADGLAILVGKVLGKRLPETLIKYSAATLFMGAGIYTLVEAFLAR